ncbi:MAG: hypothetical protein QNJ26_15430 [Desulfobacterales bacterium]|nr:hypothetical protein [Desulfobacterales bacterium]
MQVFSDGRDSGDLGPDGSVDRNRAILNYIRKSMRATWPWTRFLSILGFIGTGLTILAGLGMIIGESIIPVSEKTPPLLLMGILYILSSVIYLIPSIWLSKYATAISAFLKAGDAIELGKAIAYQKSFWKFIGILTLISIGLALVGIAAAILIPAFFALRA